ncbi:MAG: dephospho-CoA kinase, partial [Acidobacteria bacterium]
MTSRKASLACHFPLVSGHDSNSFLMDAFCFGLTGGVATGKTTVAGMFRDLGAVVIDADEIGHQAISAGQPAYGELLARFGRGILAADGEIDRRRLGALVFADPEKRAALDAIVHPRILRRVEELASEYHAQAPGAVILVDAALIFEADIGGRLKKVIVTWCRPEQQLARLVARTGLPLAEAQLRIAAQIPI